MSPEPVSPPPSRLLALLQVRNEEYYLPGWLAQLEGWVDGVVALDDGSTDRTAQILEASPLVLELLRKSPSQTWDERGNQIALVQAGRRHGADWFLCLDADERVETNFAREARDLMRQADAEGIQVYQLQFRHLWGDWNHYRTDGIWSRQHGLRFFKNVPTHKRFDLKQLHRFWVPLEILSNVDKVSRHSQRCIYHLSTMHSGDRQGRVERYERLDPEHRFHPIGYRYLADEAGLVVEAIPEGRGYYPHVEAAGSPAPP